MLKMMQKSLRRDFQDSEDEAHRAATPLDASSAAESRQTSRMAISPNERRLHDEFAALESQAMVMAREIAELRAAAGQPGRPAAPHTGPDSIERAAELSELSAAWTELWLRGPAEAYRESWRRLRLGDGFAARLALLISAVRWLLRGELRAQLRRHRAARVLVESKLFDQAYYVSQLRTLGAAAPIPVEHYLDNARAGGPAPNSMFDGVFYLNNNADVAASGENPLVHFIEHGALEGRSPHPLFDTAYYLTTYPDVLHAGINPLQHYLEFGIAEGRWPKAPSEAVERVVEQSAELAIDMPAPDSGKPRILVMDYRIPKPEISAGELATVGIVRDLSELGFDVTFLPNGMEPDPAHAAELERWGVNVVTRTSGYRSSSEYIRARGAAYGAYYLIRVDVAESVIDVIRAFAPRARLIFHAPDVYFLRQGREAELRDDPQLRVEAERMRDRELAMMRRVDHNVVVSPAELPVLRQYLPDAPISVFPVLYVPVLDEPPPYDFREDIFFLGGFAHPPNVDAVLWFVSEIWPLARARLPGVRFHIVGSEPPEALRALGKEPGVCFDGFVKDLGPLLSTMRVGVAPIRFGAGIKGKVAMSMGAGIPCVCTTIAAEGMGIADGSHGRVVDDPAGFADALVELYQSADVWERLSANGRDLVDRRFGDKANRASLLQVLDDAGALPIQLYAARCASLPGAPVSRTRPDETIDVSIIVPVYNQWAFTRACLNSILLSCAADDLSYELILADDGSSDETVDAAALYPGLRVVKTPTNVGFLRNCNNAARHARGRHLLLLNNDTVVLPGWLSSMYELIEADPSAAIVGSKLLYPDETLQEAGAVLWRDGTAVNCGRGMPRRQPEYEFVREIDYVSGASFLIRRSFWDAVGGFDERYQNAYCEDSDLAMTARASGMRVLYQPRSEVIHFEHKSYSGDLSHRPLQLANIERLLSKWGDVFARDHLTPTAPTFVGMAQAERSASPAALARRRSRRLNILYFSPFPSHPGAHGNRSTIQEFGRRFQAMGHKVFFVGLKNQIGGEDGVAQMRAAWDNLDILDYDNPLVADGNPILFDAWYEEGLGEQIHTLCEKHDIDVMFCSYVFQSRMLDYVPQHILKVIDTHDKMGDRYDMLRANGQPLEFFSCPPEEEGAYLRRADLVIARRSEEASYFDSVTGLETAIVVPHVEPPRFVERSWKGVSSVGLVASPNRINLSIVREFLEAVNRRAASDGGCPFTVHVAGQVKEMVDRLSPSEQSPFSQPWVRMLGYLPDIEQFYRDMDVIVSPVTMGTGINVKTVQAMAYGMPLLTTACGIKGIETGDRMHAHLDVEALVDSLFKLVGKPKELARLAKVSRTRFTRFHAEAMASMERIFDHPKLLAPALADAEGGADALYEVVAVSLS